MVAHGLTKNFHKNYKILNRIGIGSLAEINLIEYLSFNEPNRIAMIVKKKL